MRRSSNASRIRTDVRFGKWIAVGHALGVNDRNMSTMHGNCAVSGVGFLGGGAILRSGDSVHGMTTAATIWVNAAVGVAAGAGEYGLAASATALTLVVLALLPPIEAYFERRTGAPNCHVPGFSEPKVRDR